MKLYLDENMAPKEATALRQAGHDVVYVNEHKNLRGLQDQDHARNAQNDSRVLVTKDVDFGSLRHKDGIPTTGVVYITPNAERERNTEQRLPEVVKTHESDLNRGAFVTVDADKTRVRELDTLSLNQSKEETDRGKQSGQAQTEPVPAKVDNPHRPSSIEPERKLDQPSPQNNQPKSQAAPEQAPARKSLSDHQRGDGQADRQQKQEGDNRPGERLIDRYKRPDTSDPGMKR